MSDDSPNKLLQLIPDSVDNVVENLTDLPSKGIGQTLSDCWYLIFGGISQVANKRRIKYATELQKYKKELEASLAKVPEENKIEPSTQIVMSTLDESKYCVEEEELRKLFVELLTSSTDARKTVHPSFPNIIRQMSSNDAKLLNIFKSNELYPLCDVELLDEKRTRMMLKNNVFLPEIQSLSEEQKSLSISSLTHLGILQIPFGIHLPDEEIYTSFKTSSSYLSLLQRYDEKSLFIEKKIVKLTSLGELFISCCFNNNVNEART